MNTNFVFNITDNTQSGTNYTLIARESNDEIMLIETPKEATASFHRQFLRITHQQGFVEICMAVNGEVPFDGSMVAGFPQTVTINIPDYLFPMLQQAIASIK